MVRCGVSRWDTSLSMNGFRVSCMQNEPVLFIPYGCEDKAQIRSKYDILTVTHDWITYNEMVNNPKYLSEKVLENTGLEEKLGTISVVLLNDNLNVIRTNSKDLCSNINNRIFHEQNKSKLTTVVINKLGRNIIGSAVDVDVNRTMFRSIDNLFKLFKSFDIDDYNHFEKINNLMYILGTGVDKFVSYLNSTKPEVLQDVIFNIAESYGVFKDIPLYSTWEILSYDMTLSDHVMLKKNPNHTPLRDFLHNIIGEVYDEYVIYYDENRNPKHNLVSVTKDGYFYDISKDITVKL